MTRQVRTRILASFFSLALAVTHLLAFLGQLTPFNSAQIERKFPTLIYSLPLALYGWSFLYVLLLIYLLYSANVITPYKSEFARQYTAIADVGLLLLCPVEIARIFFWHSGLLGVPMLLRLVSLIVLIRVAMGYAGNPSRPFWGRAVFDLWLGWTEFLLVTDFAMFVSGISGATPPFSEQVWNIFLLVLVSAGAAAIGLRLLSPLSILAVLLSIASVAGRHLSPQGLDGRYPAIYITAILCMAVLVTVFIICVIKRRRSYWR